MTHTFLLGVLLILIGQDICTPSTLTSLPAPSPIVSRDVCQWQDFTASCGANDVIIMEHANYGRMQLGSCVTEDLGYLGCTANVLHLADRKCSGRHECNVRVPDADFEATRPCSELQNYLEASFRCYPVQIADRPICTRCDVIKLTSPNGYLGSIVTEETGCGSADCPWLIEAGSGQTVAIRMLDFDYAASTSSSSGVCTVYAVLKEEITRKSVTICGGQQREEDVYRSETNSVEVRILRPPTDNPNIERGHYLLHYRFLGCADLPQRTGMTFSRMGDVASVTCDVTGDSVTIRCNGSAWIGDIPNCDVLDPGTDMNDAFGFSFNWGLSSIIIIAIAVSIGACILIAGLLYYRRKTHVPPQCPPPMPTDPVYEVHGQIRPMEMPYHEVMDTGSTLSKSDTMRRQMDFRNEYTHIWERPLPPPKAEPYPQHV